jgi:hypothetical protein
MKRTLWVWLLAVVCLAVPGWAGCSEKIDKADHKVDGLEMEEPPLGGEAPKEEAPNEK